MATPGDQCPDKQTPTAVPEPKKKKKMSAFRMRFRAATADPVIMERVRELTANLPYKDVKKRGADAKDKLGS